MFITMPVTENISLTVSVTVNRLLMVPVTVNTVNIYADNIRNNGFSIK